MTGIFFGYHPLTGKRFVFNIPALGDGNLIIPPYGSLINYGGQTYIIDSIDYYYDEDKEYDVIIKLASLPIGV